MRQDKFWEMEHPFGTSTEHLLSLVIKVDLELRAISIGCLGTGWHTPHKGKLNSTDPCKLEFLEQVLYLLLEGCLSTFPYRASWE